MNVKRFLSDSFRRNIDNKINTIIINHNIVKKQSLTDTKTSAREATFEIDSSAELTEDDACAIYKRKCSDLELIPNDSSQLRFVEQFLNSIRKKTLNFTGLGLGPLSSQYLMALLPFKRPFYFMDLSLNRLSDQGASYLAEYLSYDPLLIQLDLKSNNIGIDGCVQIFEGLMHNQHLTTLDLSAIDGIDRNRIGTPGCEALANLLLSNGVLCNLNIAMCGVTAEGCHHIGQALPNNTSLTHLDLSSNRFGSAGANSMFSQPGALGALESLVLSRNLIGDDAGPALVTQLSRAKSLRYLDLSRNNFTKGFLKYILQAYDNGCRVSNLSLAHNKLNESLEYLCHVLKTYSKIRILNLSGNKIGDNGIIKLMESLEQNTSLSILDLSQTECTSKGAAAISVVLANGVTPIQKLYLNNNKISDDGGVRLFEAIENNTTLVSISLKNNEMKDKTAATLIKILKTNTTIGDIDVTMNDFSYRSYVKVASLIEEHKKTLNSNIAGVAERHVDFLKGEEKRLMKFREDIKEQESIVEQTSVQKSLHLEELSNLKNSCEEQLKKMEGEYEAAREAHTKATDFRLETYNETNKLKMDLERVQSELRRDFENKASNRQRAEMKLKQAQDQRKEQEEAHKAKMDELNEMLNNNLKALNDFIKGTMAQKESILQAERDAEEAKKREEEEKLQEEKKAAKGKKSTKKKKTKTEKTGTDDKEKKPKKDRASSLRPQSATKTPRRAMLQ
ncbi:Leucine Rich Repeat family protein [Trichomonas vaginalis G3]|uniref:Leucine Rich Repeat family protein n=1 Tax=Trichomonas vaginalis (strain ATCC PRA-98 / G3) TaxID=412133 RepID=A2FUS5_TRIV3|nr:uncharacterized protein TVAGG3_0927560 [Trichomonas vaginalis G3]EAX91339.1 Leucine Rich Repeat family protein [Trichomonas vaginalis G3]KAI5485594.1 interleukin-8 biosynthetic process [Trichomonas vaginalis G3]|eukprot:XP_001304269.1 hypothetical protein [Trichomonas vaginalis G3]